MDHFKSDCNFGVLFSLSLKIGCIEPTNYYFASFVVYCIAPANDYDDLLQIFKANFVIRRDY